MRVDWLSLIDFRSYSSLEWRPDPGVNVLIGPNGAGKTNLLESTGYLASLKSFRSVKDSALIADDKPAAVIRAGLTSEERERLIEIEIPAQGQRRTQVDKTRLRRNGRPLRCGEGDRIPSGGSRPGETWSRISA